MKNIYNIFISLLVVCLLSIPATVLSAESTVDTKKNSKTNTQTTNSKVESTAKSTSKATKPTNNKISNSKTTTGKKQDSSATTATKANHTTQVAQDQNKTTKTTIKTNSKVKNTAKSTSKTTPNTQAAQDKNKATKSTIKTNSKVKNTAKSTSKTTPNTQAAQDKNKATKSTNNKVANSKTKVDKNQEAFTKAKAQNIVNSINKNYSFLYDPTMNPDLMVDILQNPQNYVVLFFDRDVQDINSAVLIKVMIKENPKPVKQFMSFVKQGLYDNMKVFRLIPHYFMQTGDPTNSGYGGSGLLRKASINKKLHFERGTVAFSNLDNLNSDDSQFFITYNKFPWLDNKYSVFGKVIYGMNLLENLSGTYHNDGFILNSIVIYKTVVLSDWEKGAETLFKNYPATLKEAKIISASHQSKTSNKNINKSNPLFNYKK